MGQRYKKPMAKCKHVRNFAEAEYLRRSQEDEKPGTEASVSLIRPRRSIFDKAKDTKAHDSSGVGLMILPKQGVFGVVATHYIGMLGRETRQFCGGIAFARGDFHVIR